MTLAGLVGRYALFAGIATLVNLATQHAAMPVAGLGPAMVAGTLAGLATKYALDKRYIFADPATGMQAHARKFGLYSAMGILTTALFWATELAFDAAFGTALMRDVGALLGLAVGYATKYRLDRRFVFDGGPR